MRVTNAAEQMRSTNSHGSFRGYVPIQQEQRDFRHHSRYENEVQFSSSAGGNGQRGYATHNFHRKTEKGKSHLAAILVTLLALIAITGATLTGIHLSREAAEKKRISNIVTPYDQLYCQGVYVDGIHLGGMTPEQAMNSVQSQISQKKSSWKIELTYEGRVVAEVNAETLNMQYDQNMLINTMNDAWTYGHTGTIEQRYAQMEDLKKTPYIAYTSKPSGNTDTIEHMLNHIKSMIDIPAQDASLRAFDPAYAYPFLFNHEVVGLSLDTGPILEKLYEMVNSMSGGTLELVPQKIQPQITQVDLEKHYQLRASVTTPIDRHSDDNRNNNIRRCFELISGTVLDSGKTFSFNGVVGERTLNNGFYPAIEYISDEHVVGIGGGSCQASTTLYQAAVCAGLEILSRRPHSDSVSYADYGKDATVYWMRGGKQIDMSFKNNTNGKIYIVAQVLNDPSNKGRLMCKVNIYGEDLENISYRLETETVEILPSLMEPVYVKDKASAAKAKDGCIVNSYRETYTDGILTDRSLLFTDTYKPKPEKIYDPLLSEE